MPDELVKVEEQPIRNFFQKYKKDGKRELRTYKSQLTIDFEYVHSAVIEPPIDHQGDPVEYGEEYSIIAKFPIQTNGIQGTIQLCAYCKSPEEIRQSLLEAIAQAIYDRNENTD